jgi:hypothetical protein
VKASSCLGTANGSSWGEALTKCEGYATSRINRAYGVANIQSEKGKAYKREHLSTIEDNGNVDLS